MHSFHYHQGQLRCEGVDLAALAAEHSTPLYVYSAQTIRDHYRRLDAALAGVNRLIIVNPLGPNMAEQTAALIAAAQRSGVSLVVRFRS